MNESNKELVQTMTQTEPEESSKTNANDDDACIGGVSNTDKTTIADTTQGGFHRPEISLEVLMMIPVARHV